MTYTASKMTLIAAVTAATITTFSLTVPAAAGGSVSFDFRPQNARQENAMRLGLGIYGIINSAQNGGTIRQRGHNNRAGVGQNGSGNYGIVHQEGNGHNGTLNQNGNGNAYGIFQFGENTNANVSQYGNGGTGATFVFGW